MKLTGLATLWVTAVLFLHLEVTATRPNSSSSDVNTKNTNKSDKVSSPSSGAPSTTTATAAPPPSAPRSSSSSSSSSASSSSSEGGIAKLKSITKRASAPSAAAMGPHNLDEEDIESLLESWRIQPPHFWNYLPHTNSIGGLHHSDHHNNNRGGEGGGGAAAAAARGRFRHPEPESAAPHHPGLDMMTPRTSADDHHHLSFLPPPPESLVSFHLQGGQRLGGGGGAYVHQDEDDDQGLDEEEYNPSEPFNPFSKRTSSGTMQHQSERKSTDKRTSRPYDVPIIDCPPADDGMERFACPTPDRQGRYRCIDDHVLCDGFSDCPNSADEDRHACMFYKTTKAHLDVLADALLRWARGKR